MVKYNPKEWLSLIFHAYTWHIIRSLIPSLIFMFFYTTAVTVLVMEYNVFKPEKEMGIHSLVGIVLGLFLVFRTNTAYDRWWEGRKVWGALLNDSRNLAMKLNAFLNKADSQHRIFFSEMITNYAYAMKEHLREGVKEEEVNFSEKADKDTFTKYAHKPNSIASMLYEKITRLYKEKVLSGEQLFLVDKEVKALTDYVGMCERIKNTPIPFAYSMYMKKFIFIYAFTLPIGLVAELGYWTIPTVLFLFYIFVSIEVIAEEIENPFGGDDNDLPTDELAGKIKANVQEILL